MAQTQAGTAAGTQPRRAAMTLAALILAASVANLNLSAANVALPSIGKDLDCSQTALDLIAVGYSLGLAASVLYLGALGDRHGRKMMLVLGMVLSLPAAVIAAYANTASVVFIGRLIGGVAAGMAYPTTLALITALWSGPRRTQAIALWSALGGAMSVVGSLTSGWLLEHFWWGSVFLVTLPLATLGLILTLIYVPSHVNESTEKVDNLGGVLSVLMVAALVLAINFAAVPDKLPLTLSLVVIMLAAAIAFVIRQRRAKPPLYDLAIAARRIFWVAAVGGMIVFGSLMAALFVGQQFLQNVLEYSPLESGLAILPAAFTMIVTARPSATMIERYGCRITLAVGYVFFMLGFITMLVLWREGTPYWQVGLAYALVGVGVGLAGTPASRSLTGAAPVWRAGMSSATADLQRDLGGAVMQSILGALLTAGYAAAVGSQIASAPPQTQQLITTDIQAELQKSFGSALEVAQRYPQYASAITQGARESFLSGANWAYAAGIFAVLIGVALVWFRFPRRDEENRLLAEYAATDARTAPAAVT